MWYQFDFLAVGFLLLSSYTPALAHPQPITDIVAESSFNERAAYPLAEADTSELWKRKGGGGKGGKGGSGGSGSTGSSSGKGSTSSNTGGSTKQGSGIQPSYGGGRYYSGGATTPYRAGLATPLGISAVFIGASALAFYPGSWGYGAYGYPYHNPYTFRNHSATNNTNNDRRSTQDMWISTLVGRQDTGVEQTKNVTCLCAADLECGCDDNGNTTILDSLIGDGSYANLNKSLINVALINGSSVIILNGTLSNGTTIAGGTEDADGNSTSTGDSTGDGGAKMVQASGWLVMIALVGCTVLLV